MTKYTIESLDKGASIVLVVGWTPQTLYLLASIGDIDEAWIFDSLTEAQLTLFLLESDVPQLTHGMNFIVVAVSVPDPQRYFNL